MEIVYVLSNLSMQGIYKIGFTTRSIRERIKELSSSTSIPTRFKLEYFVELEDGAANGVERSAHEDLIKMNLHHGKEYFQCSLFECKEAIFRAITKQNATVVRSNDNEITAKRVAELRRLDEIKELEIAAAMAKERILIGKETEIRQKFNLVLYSISDPGDFKFWFAGIGLTIAFVVSEMFSNYKFEKILFISVVLGAILSFILREWYRQQKINSEEYRAVEAKRDIHIHDVRNHEEEKIVSKKSTLNSDITSDQRYEDLNYKDTYSRDTNSNTKTTADEIALSTELHKNYYIENQITQSENINKDQIQDLSNQKNYSLADLSWSRGNDGIHCQLLQEYYPNGDFVDDGVDVEIRYRKLIYHIPIKKIDNYEYIQLQKLLF